ncbi:MFS transporter [Microvirga sp. M2]|uniref:MFS transporter n=1 Tax=Microvirga sp. M2 TaxID=3073270 RepID=UPI0039C41249
MSPDTGIAKKRTPVTEASASPWAPFRHRAYAVIWTATLIANIGYWMYSAASGWLMTSLDAHPLMVSLVQVAASLPMFLFALPAGALADIVDRRLLLIGVEIGTTTSATALAALVSFDLVTPASLLFFVFLAGTGSALGAPAWQSVVPQLVPMGDLPAAVAADSVGINISRAIGPALGGAHIAVNGIATPFWVNAIANLATVAALLWWRPPPRMATHLPAERFASAIRTGFRYSRNNRPLQATLKRAAGFFVVASAYWALLPLVARAQIAGGPELYGLLLGAIGAGALAGAFALSGMKARLGPNRIAASGTLGTAVALLLFGLAREPVMAAAASLIAGLSWISVVATLNVSAQIALPDWVRARGLAIYVTVFFGAMTLGSIIWGELAAHTGLPLTLYIAAAGAVLAVLLSSRWRLLTAAGLDLAPSMHWPPPVVAHEIEGDQGPVLITIEYRILPEDRDAFLSVMETLSRERKRDGAYACGLFEDAAQPGRFVETFLVESWLEHLRQHQRVTNADRNHEEKILRLTQGTPRVTHLIAASPEAATAQKP